MDVITTHSERDPNSRGPDSPAKDAPRGSPIGVESLLDRCMQDPGFALALLSELENSAPQLVELLAEQVQADDAAAAAESLHQLKGASGIVSADHLHELARRGEAAGREGNGQQLKTLLPKIRKGLDECLEFLPTLRDRLS